MAAQNLDGLLSDSSPDDSQACSLAFTSQSVNEYVITTIRSSSFGGGTGSSMQRNEIIIRQRVMNQQHQGRTTQSQSRSQDFAYAARQGLTEFTNANRAAEPHLRQASSNRPFASSNSGSQRNNQIGIAHDAWDILSNLNPGASNAFAPGNSSNGQANDGGSSLFHGHGTVMQHAYNRDSRIQSNIQCPCPVHGHMHCRPSPVGVNVAPMNMHHTALIYRENFLGGAPEVIMNALPTTAISPDMPHQTHFCQDISAFIPGDVDTILTELLPFIHDPNLAADVTDTFAIPTGMRGPFAHEQHFPGVVSSDLHTGPANSQMNFVPDQNISRAPPVVVSQNPNSLQGPLDGQSSSAVVPRDKRIRTNTRRPPVSGQNLSSVVPRDTNKTLINQGESFSNAVPRDTEKSSIYGSKPSAHRQGPSIPLPADTNAFTRESVARSSIATQGQTFLPGQFIPLSTDTNVFTRGSTAESSIATQGQTSSQGDTNKTLINQGESFSNAVPRDTEKSSICESKPSAHRQGLSIPLPADTNAFTRESVAKSSIAIATQGQTFLPGQFIPLSTDTNVFTRGSAAESSIATQGQTSLQGDTNKTLINQGESFSNAVPRDTEKSSICESKPSAHIPLPADTNAFARESVAKSSIATQGQTFSPGQFIPCSADTNVFARGSTAESSIATQGQTSSLGDTNKTLINQGESFSNAVPRDTEKSSICESKPSAHRQGPSIPLPADTNAFARESVAKSSIATQGQTSSPGQFIPCSADTNVFARGSTAESSIATQGQTSSQGDTIKTLINQGESFSNAVPRDTEKSLIYESKPSAHRQGLSIPLPADTNAFARESVAKSSIATQGQTFSPGQFIPLSTDTNVFARGSAAQSSIATQGQTSSQGDTNAFARFAGSAAGSSIATKGQTSSQGLFIPSSGCTNGFARFAGSAAGSSFATQGQNSSHGLFVPSSGRTNAFARFAESAAGSSFATQGQNSSPGQSIPLPADTDAFAGKSAAKSSIAAQEQTFLPFQSNSLPADTDAFARRSVEKSSIAAQGQTSVAKSTNAIARKSAAKSSIAAQEQTSLQDLSTPQSRRTRAKALARKFGAKSSIPAQEQTSLEPLSKRINNNSEGGWNLAVEKGTKLGSSMFNQSSATDKDKSSPSLVPAPQEVPIRQVRTREGAEFKLVGEKCQLCNIDLAFNPTGSTSSSSHNNTILPIPAVLPCGHCYHYDCLKSIYGSPGKGEVPPCIHCSEGVAWSKD